MKIKFKFEFETGKTFEDLKEKAKNFVSEVKSDSNVQKAQKKVKGFVTSAVATANNAIDKIEEYIDQKHAEEKEAGPDNITEDFFKEAEEYDEVEDSDTDEVTEDDVEEELETEEVVEEKVDIPSGVKLKRNANTMTLEEFLDEIVGFEKSDKEPDISEETEDFLWAIEYCASDVSKSAFKVAVNLPKITYASVINAIEKDFPEMTKMEIRKQLQADFKNWVNLRHPDVKEDCPNANSITLMKCWAKKFNEF